LATNELSSSELILKNRPSRIATDAIRGVESEPE